VLVYLGLGVAAATSDDTVLVAAAYLAMDRTAWTVLVPLAGAVHRHPGGVRRGRGRTPLTAADVALLRSPSVVVHSTGALVLLATATVLAIRKPVGLTPHGQRVRRADPVARSTG
jgi:hypothetical protein